MFSRAWPCSLALLVVLVASPRPGLADDKAEARKIGAEGLALARAGSKENDTKKVLAAVAKFQQAFALDPNPEYRCAIGIAYRGIGKLARAHLYFGRCVARISDAARKAQMRRVVVSVEGKLRSSGHAPVDVVTRPAGATVAVSHFGADDTFSAPWQIWLPPGQHTVRASSPGHHPNTTTIQVKKDIGTVSVRVTLEKVVVAKVTEPSAPPKRIERPLTTTPSGQIDHSRRKRGTAPWVLISVGGAAGLAGAAFHLLAVRSIGDLDGLSGTARSDKISTIKNQRNIAVGGYVVGGITAGVGAYLLLRSRRSTKSSSVALGPAPGGGSMVWLTFHR